MGPRGAAAAGTDPPRGKAGKVATNLHPPKGPGETDIGDDPDYSVLLVDAL